MNLPGQLADGLTALELDVGSHAQALLLDYLGLLEKWNKTYNLTAIHEPGRMLTHHLLDSLAILPFVGAGPVLDVGSGAGLPGIPLAILRPATRVTLLDASQKKCSFMRQAAIDLGLPNVTVVHGRVEDFRPDAGFLQIVSRAFSDLTEFVRLTRHLVAEGGEWLAMKGLYPNEEISQLKGARVIRDVPLQVPGLDAARHLIVMEPL
jgi:16S rRNA (guanine527-N7)-methyltransferase